MTTIAPFLPPQDELSASARRVDAANQRDNWLRQMELAQMGQMGATPGPAAPPPRAAMTSLAQAPMHAALHPAAREDSAGASDAPDEPNAEAAHDGGAAHAGQGRQAHDHARMTEDDGAEAASTAAAAVALTAATPPAQPLAVGAAPGAAAEPAGLPAGGLAPAMAPGAVQGGADASLPLAAAPQATGLAVSLTAALRAPQATPAESNAAAEAPEAPSSGADAAGEAPDWQKRMMHLTGDGDDIQLWIRDGELSPAQSQQLVARLAADVAAMGLRLKEATVNGKPALRAAVRDADDSADTLLPITHPTTER